ncbi:urease accessory protein UreD [Corynebacterium sp. 4HC-13]|uniref:Urease accessory protein UreD n=1 Tax=Corynebacterium anserum TaxID=2684406 RepID=A0A7G7YRC8_9CORY|nr:urease accessory protein UreD [Corynebacterium anserum]QNH97048.1 urease accessory protein UreD [Corynebacterium anserum]
MNPRWDPRLDTAQLTPPIPREVRAFLDREAPSKHSGVLAVGQPGKVGVLELTLGVGQSGRTGLRERFAKAPMSLTRPLYVDPCDKNHAVLYLRTTGGGLAENDRIRQKFVLEEGARATVSTQAATNVHRMNAGVATQWVSFSLGPNACLEYFPGHTTLYGGSRLVQLTECDVPSTASVIAGEMTLLGRVARGEVHEFDAFSLGLRVTRDGRPLLADTVVTVGAGNGRNLMVWGDYPVWGTILAVTPSAFSTPPAQLMDMCRSAVAEIRREDIVAGVSTLVGGAGVMVRIAGYSSVGVREVMGALHDVLRQKILGKSSFDLRRM